MSPVVGVLRIGRRSMKMAILANRLVRSGQPGGMRKPSHVNSSGKDGPTVFLVWGELH